MYIADMHNDSLLAVSSDRGLISKYNLTKEHNFLQFFAAFTPCDGRPPEQRRRELMRLANVYLWETERLGITNVKEVRDLIDAKYENKSCAILSIEGGGGLFAESEELYSLHKMGLRVLGPVWDTNELGCSCYEEEDTGLTERGRLLIAACAALGITVDVSHLSDRGFYEALEIPELRIIATHSNFRDIAPSRRNLTRDMARTIVNRGGVIGLNLYPPFLKDGGGADISDIMKHIDYALENFGEGSIGFGFDIDGTDGVYPEGIDESRSIHDRVFPEVIRRYGESAAEKIAGGNVIDYLLGAL